MSLSIYECLIAYHPDLFDTAFLNGLLSHEKLGINDLQKTENVIWKDLNNSLESYVFKVREISIKDICLAAFYNYKTSLESQQYSRK